MDGFSYVDIFATKGVEYLVVIAFLLLLIPFWLILNRKARVAREIRKAYKVLTANMLRIRNGLYYSKFHTWTFMERSGRAKVGLDDLLLNITGDVKVNYLQEPGTEIKKGDRIAELRQNGKHLEIHSPVSGRIERLNPLLGHEPALLNEDPYGKGWLLEVEPVNWKAETSAYFLAGEASEWIKQDLIRFKDFLAVEMGKHSPGTDPVALQDGGELVSHVLSELPECFWTDFQKEFLEPHG